MFSGKTEKIQSKYLKVNHKKQVCCKTKSIRKRLKVSGNKKPVVKNMDGSTLGRFIT